VEYAASGGIAVDMFGAENLLRMQAQYTPDLQCALSALLQQFPCNTGAKRRMVDMR